METTLDLNNLASSLPSSNLANAEKDLTNNFKAAALSLTTLYRSSRRTSKRAYNAGYAAACQDLLLMIQQGVSTGESSDTVGRGMTIGRIMDYIEARLEAIKSREEEEDEDEEKDRTKPGGAAQSDTKQQPPPPKAGPSASASSVRHRDSVVAPSPVSSFAHVQSAPVSPPSAPPPVTSRSAPPQPPQPAPRQTKSRLFALSNGKEPALVSSIASSPLALNPPSTASVFPSHGAPAVFPPSPSVVSDLDTAVGTKRRHTAMMLDAAPDPSPVPGTSRRRTRSSRALALPQDHGLGAAPDAMDVEDEGRERKRVARR